MITARISPSSLILMSLPEHAQALTWNVNIRIYAFNMRTLWSNITVCKMNYVSVSRAIRFTDGSSSICTNDISVLHHVCLFYLPLPQSYSPSLRIPPLAISSTIQSTHLLSSQSLSLLIPPKLHIPLWPYPLMSQSCAFTITIPHISPLITTATYSPMVICRHRCCSG